MTTDREVLLDEAASLLNRGEDGAALKVLRQLHCLHNVWQCRECNYQSSACKAGGCPQCSGEMRAVVIRAPAPAPQAPAGRPAAFLATGYCTLPLCDKCDLRKLVAMPQPSKAVTEEELKALMYQELKAAEPFGTAYAANVCARVAMRVLGGKG